MAKEFGEKMNFAISNKADFSNELSALGLDSNTEVVVGIYDSKGKYAMPEKFR